MNQKGMHESDVSLDPIYRLVSYTGRLLFSLDQSKVREVRNKRLCYHSRILYNTNVADNTQVQHIETDLTRPVPVDASASSIM